MSLPDPTTVCRHLRTDGRQTPPEEEKPFRSRCEAQKTRRTPSSTTPTRENGRRSSHLIAKRKGTASHHTQPASHGLVSFLEVKSTNLLQQAKKTMMFQSAAKTLMRNARTVSSTRAMSSTAKVWVDKNTRVICQGFTGKQVREVSDCKHVRVALQRQYENHAL